MKTKTFFLAAILLAVSLLKVLPLGKDLGWASCFAQAPNQPGAGNCLNFNGSAINTTGYVNCGTNASLNITGSISTSCWVKKNGTSPFAEGGIDVVYVSKCCCVFDRQWYMSYNDVTNRFWFGVFKSDSRGYIIGATTSFNTGEWYYVAGTYNQTTGELLLYINGVLTPCDLYTMPIGGGPLTLIASNNTNNNIGSITLMNRPLLPVLIGAYWANSSYTEVRAKTNGQIDEVCIWDRTLTQTEIRDNMCSKLVGSEANLKGYWRFDETGGNTYFDSSPNGNNGTGF